MRSALRHAYQSVLGAFPERLPPLTASVGTTAFAATQFAPSDARPAPAVTPAWPSQPGVTTAQPVAADATQEPVELPRRSPVAALAAVGGALVLLVGVGFGVRAMRTEGSTVASPSTPEGVVTAAVVSPAASSVAVAALQPVASATTFPGVDAGKAPAVNNPNPPPPLKRPMAPPVAATPPPAPPHAGAGGNCSPPFYFDAQGSKVFKKECL
jgi:hypothetical protein